MSISTLVLLNIHDHRWSFNLLSSSSISVMTVPKFLFYKPFTVLLRFIPEYCLKLLWRYLFPILLSWYVCYLYIRILFSVLTISRHFSECIYLSLLVPTFSLPPSLPFSQWITAFPRTSPVRPYNYNRSQQVTGFDSIFWDMSSLISKKSNYRCSLSLKASKAENLKH